jgi:PIN domain nuclease of toxin-antitoxin system
VRLLLDTHILLWASGWGVGPGDRSPLSVEAIDIIGAADNQPVFSVASIWEIAIKQALGRPQFTIDPRLLRGELLNNGYHELPVLGEHAAAVTALPPLHKDPFDRLLIAQATVEGILLLTGDRTVARYPGPIRSV